MAVAVIGASAASTTSTVRGVDYLFWDALPSETPVLNKDAVFGALNGYNCWTSTSNSTPTTVTTPTLGLIAPSRTSRGAVRFSAFLNRGPGSNNGPHLNIQGISGVGTVSASQSSVISNSNGAIDFYVGNGASQVKVRTGVASEAPANSWFKVAMEFAANGNVLYYLNDTLLGTYTGAGSFYAAGQNYIGGVTLQIATIYNSAGGRGLRIDWL